MHAAVSAAPAEIRPTRSRWSISARERWIALLLLAAVGAVYVWAARYWIDPFEEGYFTYLASRVAQGDHPYRDFATPYTPAFFYLHALIFQVFGYNLVWQRVFVILARIVGAALLYLLARRLAPARYAVLAPLTLLLLDPAPAPWQTHPSWYAAPSATAAALSMLRYLDNRRWKWLSLAAVFAALAFAFKQNVGLLTLLALVSFAALACPKPIELERLIERLDAWAPPWLARLPALCGVLLVPMAMIFVLRARPLIEYGVEYALPLLVLNVWLYGRSLPDRDSLARAGACVGTVLLTFAVVTVPWVLALAFQITRHELPLRQFVGGVDPAGYILDQWWPHADGLVALAAGPALTLACWEWGRGRHARALGWLLGELALLLVVFTLTRIPGRSPLTALTDISLLLTENMDQLLPAAVAGLVVLACLGGWVSPGDDLFVAWLLTFGATAFFLQYPRMDEPHLIFSAPPMMAPLAWFLARLEGRIVPLKAHPGLVGLTALVLLTVPLLSLVPVTNWRWSMLIPARSDSERLRPHTYVPLRNPRGGVLAMPYIADPLDATSEQIRVRTGSEEPVFVFPAAPMLYYLADRRNATRYNHFLPGLVSHDEELETIRLLDERSVRVVVLEPAFELLWLRDTDYPELRGFLRSEYRLSEEIGPYEIRTR